MAKWTKRFLAAVLAVFTVFAAGCGLFQRAPEELTAEHAQMNTLLVCKDGSLEGLLVEEFPEFGLKTLCVINEYDGERYFKRLYCAADEDSGVRYLYESYISEEGEFSPDSGESLCELESFDPSLENGVLTVSLKAADGTEKTIRMALRAGGGTQ